MMKVFAVRDVKADAFSALHPAPTEGIARRAFAEACQDGRSDLAKYPEDYQLYEIGEFDHISGSLKGHQLPILVCSALEVLRAAKMQRTAVGEEKLAIEKEVKA